jgi:hypothetical protein
MIQDIHWVSQEKTKNGGHLKKWSTLTPYQVGIFHFMEHLPNNGGQNTLGTMQFNYNKN